MIIKRSIVENWYQRDSWVYKNFEYLFKNPLWNKSVPKGFSVCPYFWLSLISLFVFRPMVVAPVEYLFKPLLKICGVPLQWLDSVAISVLEFLEIISKNSNTLRREKLEGLGALFMVIVFIVVSMVVLNGIKFYSWISSNMLLIDSFAAHWTLWWVISFGLVTIGLAIHKLFTKTKCKTFNYLWVLIGLYFVSSMIIIPTDLFLGVWTALKFVLAGFYVFFGLLIGGILFITFWLWTGIKAVALWDFFGVFPYSVWLFILGFTAIGYVVSFFVTTFIDTQWDNVRIERPEKYLKACKSQWLNVLLEVLKLDKSYVKNMFHNNQYLSGLDTYKYKAVIEFQNDILKEALYKYWSEEFKTLQNHFPILNPNIQSDINNTYHEFRFNLLFDHFKVKSKEFNSEHFSKTIAEVIDSPAISFSINQFANKLKLEDSMESQPNKLQVWCLLVTNAISSVMLDIWATIKKIVCNCFTFIAYLWMLVKSKKQGVCPYFMFKESDPALKSPSVKND